MNTRTLPSLRIPSHRGWIGHVLHHRFNLTTQRTALNRYMKIHVYKLHILASTRFTEQMNTRTLPSLRIPSHRGRSGHVLHHRLIHNTTNGAQSIYENIDIYPHVIAGHRACLGASWVVCLHLPFCTHTSCTPFFALRSHPFSFLFRSHLYLLPK